MEHEGNVDTVLRHLIEKQRLLEAGDPRHEEIRPLCILPSGTMRGTNGAGQCLALQEFNLNSVFDTAIGISTGAPVLSYLLAHQSHIGVPVFVHECTTDAFITRRPLKANLAFIVSILRGETGQEAVDETRVRASRTNLFVAVSCAKTGIGELVEIRTSRSPLVDVLHASISIPHIGEGPVALGDRTFIDGAVGLALPVRMAIERFNPTDILLLANRPRTFEDDLAVVLANRHTRKAFPDAYAVFDTYTARYEDNLEALRSFHGNVGIIWTSEMSAFERNPAVVQAASDEAYHDLRNLLARASGPVS